MKAKIFEAFLLQSKFGFSCCLDKKAHEEIWKPPIHAVRLDVNVFALSNSTIKTNKRIQTAIKT